MRCLCLGLVLTMAMSSANEHYPWGPSRTKGLLHCPHDGAADLCHDCSRTECDGCQGLCGWAPSTLELVTQYNWPDWTRGEADSVCTVGKQRWEPQLSVSRLFPVHTEHRILRSYSYFSVFWTWGDKMPFWAKYERLLFGRQASWQSGVLEGCVCKCLSEKWGASMRRWLSLSQLILNLLKRGLFWCWLFRRKCAVHTTEICLA